MLDIEIGNVCWLVCCALF